MSNPFASSHAAVGGSLGPNDLPCVCGHPVGDHLGPDRPCRAPGCDCDRPTPPPPDDD